jgi:hypothetical protein
MPACKPGLFGNILKDNRAGFYEPACGNGAVLAIKLRSLGARIGHATLGLLHPFRLPRLRRQYTPACARHQKSSNQGAEK